MSKLDTIYKKVEPIFAGSKTLTVVGGNWGDEGKGKIIDLVMRYFDAAVRFSGGANAGHTVFTDDGKKVVSHLIPCGLAQDKICVMARGEFFNAELFIKELADIKASLGRENVAEVFVDQQAPLWTPYHRLFEAYIEAMRGERKIGTTNKGIGPLEGLYKLRLAPVVGHMFAPKALEIVLNALYNVLKPSFDYALNEKLITEKIPTPQEIRDELIAMADNIKPFVADTSFLMDKMLKAGKKLLFEGAQATGLDAFWGTYPFVSSGNSASQGATLGSGLPMHNFDNVIIVCKTLPTRVGMGPFPSEMWERQAAMDFAKNNPELFGNPVRGKTPLAFADAQAHGTSNGVKGPKRDEFLKMMLEKINETKFPPIEGEGKGGVKIDSDAKIAMSQYFQVLGDERGATTGRGRSVGFLDIPWIQYSVRINGPKHIALTRFDMLSGIKKVPVVVGYKLDGAMLEAGQVPPPWRVGDVEPVMEAWEGFEENIYGISDFKALPANAKNFIQKIEQLAGVPITFIGTGPERDSIVVKS